MVTEDYVSRETYKMLKEKGYNGEFKTCYSLEGYTYQALHIYDAMKWLRKLGIVITIQTKWPTNPELCKIPYSFLIEDYRPERDLQKEHGKYYTGYSSTANMDDFLVKNNLLFDGFGFGEFKLYEQACEAAIRFCLENLI